MTTYFNAIGDVVSQLWTFLFATYIPHTNITFGGLYVSLLFFNVGMVVLSLALRKKERE